MQFLRTYGYTFLILFGIGMLGAYASPILDFLHNTRDFALLETFFTISLLFLLSYFVGASARLTKLPSFVFALLFGVLARDLLIPITQTTETLAAIVALGATLILFGGGLEVPYKNFIRLSPQILSLSFVGLSITALLLSQGLFVLAPLSPVPLSITSLVLLGCILASTDPAAIIPILRALRFKNRDVKDIIISESAVTDVTGTLLTSVFLGLFASGVSFMTIQEGYLALLTEQTGTILLFEVLGGMLAGALGFGILEFVHRRRRSGVHEDATDIAFFIAVPILTFLVASAFGGSGYLAAFIAGLVVHMTEHLHETEHFFNNLIDAFLKPIIFILLGALVNFGELFEYAGIGIAASLLFMLIIRPLAVFVSLAPWIFFGTKKLSFREALFISWVRETGAIPAVLLVAVISSGLEQNLEGLVPVGMWIIIATLVVQPPLMPYFSRILQVGEAMENEDDSPLLTETSAVLASRGHSHLRRLPLVMEWIAHHGMKRLTILLCPEDDYSKSYNEELQKTTETLVAKLQSTYAEQEHIEIQVTLIIRQGLLHDNLQNMCNSDASVTVLFVGKGVLDFRLGEIKALKVPVYFLD